MLKSITVKAVAIATGLLATTMGTAPSAEAGMRIHFGFPIGAFHAYGGHSHAYHLREIRRAKAIEAKLRRERAAAAAAAAKARKERAAAIAAAKAAEAEKKKAAAAAAIAAKQKALQAATATVPAPAKAVEPDAVETVIPPLPEKVEPLRTAANTTVTTSAETEVAEDRQPLECKRYFANVGMTISVPCSE